MVRSGAMDSLDREKRLERRNKKEGVEKGKAVMMTMRWGVDGEGE